MARFTRKRTRPKVSRGLLLSVMGGGLVAGVMASVMASDYGTPQPLCFTHAAGTGPQALALAVVDTPADRATGLMFREDLRNGEGMFFVMGEVAEVSFWMKNTPLPLDIVFLDSEMKVIRVGRGVPHSLESIPSGGPAPYVLELRAGEAGRRDLVPGADLGPVYPVLNPPPCRA